MLTKMFEFFLYYILYYITSFIEEKGCEDHFAKAMHASPFRLI